MLTRVLVNGALGRMGKTAVKAIRQNDAFVLAGETDSSSDLKRAIHATDAHIVVDFTHAAVVFENAKTIIEQGAYPVIGTSGLLPQQIKDLQALCIKKRLGGIIAPNFCISALLMMRFAAQAAQYFSEVEIVETHHEKKLDAPSSTAIKTAEMIAQERKAEPVYKKIHLTLAGARGACKEHIPIHSLRLPGFLAKQEVIFGHTGGNLVITHETIDREAFIPGILFACKKVMHLKELIYGLESLLV